MDNNYLEHFGILGMKWGRRKGKISNIKKISNHSDDHIEKAKLSKKRLNEMTNAELKRFNERAQLERTYKSLTDNSINPGKKFVQDFVATQSKNAVNQIAQKYLNQKIDDLLKKQTK